MMVILWWKLSSHESYQAMKVIIVREVMTCNVSPVAMLVEASFRGNVKVDQNYWRTIWKTLGRGVVIKWTSWPKLQLQRISFDSNHLKLQPKNIQIQIWDTWQRNTSNIPDILEVRTHLRLCGLLFKDLKFNSTKLNSLPAFEASSRRWNFKAERSPPRPNHESQY